MCRWRSLSDVLLRPSGRNSVIPCKRSPPTNNPPKRSAPNLSPLHLVDQPFLACLIQISAAIWYQTTACGYSCPVICPAKHLPRKYGNCRTCWDSLPISRNCLTSCNLTFRPMFPNPGWIQSILISSKNSAALFSAPRGKVPKSTCAAYSILPLPLAALLFWHGAFFTDISLHHSHRLTTSPKAAR